MADVGMEEITATGCRAAQVALEYIGGLVQNPARPTEDESRAVLVATSACIGSLNATLLKNCNPTAFKETQDLILRFMDSAAKGIVKEVTDGKA